MDLYTTSDYTISVPISLAADASDLTPEMIDRAREIIRQSFEDGAYRLFLKAVANEEATMDAFAERGTCFGVIKTGPMA